MKSGNRPLRRRLSPRTGFTFVELMVTLVIAVIILALAAPSMREFIARQRVQAIAKELATDLRYLRSQGIQRPRPVRINFGSNDLATCYVLYGIGTGGVNCDCARTDDLPPCGDPTAAGVSDEFKTVIVRRDSGVVLTANPVRLSLDGFNGLPTGNQTIQVSVQGVNVGGEVRVYTQDDDLIVPKLCSVSGHEGSIKACAP